MGESGSLLQKIPDDYKPLAAVVIGAIILVAIVLFHGSGLHGIMIGQDRWRARLFAHHPHLTIPQSSIQVMEVRPMGPP